jgi:hypothetical protein
LYAAVQCANRLTPVALFESPLKLGCFLAMTVPATATGLLARGRAFRRAWALLLVVMSLLACASAWAWLGVVVGTIAGTHAFAKRWLTLTLLGAAAAIVATTSLHPGVIADTQWRETQGPDVRQRYLEWQALINLLKDRSAAGTGIGCLNDYRSQYYLRLPKNNTIAAFDQNGWLAAAAELGLPGLIALCWIIGEYACRGWPRRDDPLCRAAWAGLLGGAIAQVGSALTYNGILTVFAILLAAIDCGQERSEDALA